MVVNGVVIVSDGNVLLLVLWSISLALCDFQRFMCGWGQWGSDISILVIDVLDRLDGGKILNSEDDYRDAILREYG